jgi:transposase
MESLWYMGQEDGMCGEINDKLGGGEIFKCKKCGYKEDRDVNGARNVMLKCLSELASG